MADEGKQKIEKTRLTTEKEWKGLLYRVIIEGILHKLKVGDVLTAAQERMVNVFPDYPWPIEYREMDRRLKNLEGR